MVRDISHDVPWLASAQSADPTSKTAIGNTHNIDHKSVSAMLALLLYERGDNMPWAIIIVVALIFWSMSKN